MKLISLQYPATCRDCGTALPVGSRAKWYGRGRVYGIGCHARPEGASTGSGSRYTPRPRGRCEDAPCCGCCGPYGDGPDGFAAEYGDQ